MPEHSRFHIINGIAYAGKFKNSIKVSSAKALGDMMMLLEFETGEQRLYDATDLLQYPAFKPLADENNFKNIKIEQGVVTWCDGEIDIAPETMYMNSYSYQPMVV